MEKKFPPKEIGDRVRLYGSNHVGTIKNIDDDGWCTVRYSDGSVTECRDGNLEILA